MSNGAPFAVLTGDASASRPARLCGTHTSSLLLLLRLSRP